VAAAPFGCCDLVAFGDAHGFVHSLGKLGLQIDLRTPDERVYHVPEADRWLRSTMVLQASHLQPAHVDTTL